MPGHSSKYTGLAKAGEVKRLCGLPPDAAAEAMNISMK